MQQPLETDAKRVISRDGLQSLIDALAAREFQVLGPTVHDGAIIYDQIGGVSDLPEGWRDVQDAGRYKLERRDDRALFGFVVGPHSWKKFLHPPVETLWRMEKTGEGLTVAAPDDPPQKLAFIGVRA